MEISYNDAISLIQGYPDIIETLTLSQCFHTVNGLYRCAKDDSPYFPDNWASKTYNGYSNLVQNYIRSARRYAAEVLSLYNEKKDPKDVMKDTSVERDFWYMYEIPLLEGEAGAYQLFEQAKLHLDKSVESSRVVANISYAVALGATFIIFIWVFGAYRKSIFAETRYARGGKINIILNLVLFMIPHDVLRNTKAIIEYIEGLHAALGA